MALAAGDVVLVPFPFRDQLAERTRPAIVISASGYNQAGDVILAAVTTHAPRGALDYPLADWRMAGLQLPSTLRMLFATAAEARVVLRIGHLSDRDWAEVQDRVRQVFAWP
jgi:mRNA interferase MazF